MNIVAVVQARMTSKRLPGKVLADIEDKPLLRYVIDRLRKAKTLSRIIVATSTDVSDELVFTYCVHNGIECFRGPLDNVDRKSVV